MPRTSPNSPSVGMFLALLENPLLRFAIRFLSSDRSKSGKNYLEIALDDYAGHQRSPHSPASRVTSWITQHKLLSCPTHVDNKNKQVFEHFLFKCVTHVLFFYIALFATQTENGLFVNSHFLAKLQVKL